MRKMVLALSVAAFALSSVFANPLGKTPSQFPEGDFKQWVYENISFPEEALEDKMTGLIIFNIPIDNKGSTQRISDMNIQSYPHRAIKEELLRVVRMSPDWIPAQKKGKNVVSYAHCEIDFSRKLSSEQLADMIVVKKLNEAIPQLKNYQSCEVDMIEYIFRENFNVPKSLKKSVAGLDENVDVSFTVMKNGELGDVIFSGCSHPKLAKAAEKKFAIIFSKWEPGKVNGNKWDMHYDLKFKLAFDNKGRKDMDAQYCVKYMMPRFENGGLLEFRSWVNSNLVFPKENVGKNMGIAGKVVMEFVINTDGSITNLKNLTPDANPLCVQEVERVLTLSPKWKPAILNGNPVRCKYTLPTIFNQRRNN